MVHSEHILRGQDRIQNEGKSLIFCIAQTKLILMNRTYLDLMQEEFSSIRDACKCDHGALMSAKTACT